MWNALSLPAVRQLVSPALLSQIEGKVVKALSTSLLSCWISGPGQSWSVRTGPGRIPAWELTRLKIVEVSWEVLNLRKYLHATTIPKLADSRKNIILRYLDWQNYWFNQTFILHFDSRLSSWVSEWWTLHPSPGLSLWASIWRISLWAQQDQSLSGQSSEAQKCPDIVQWQVSQVNQTHWEEKVNNYWEGPCQNCKMVIVTCSCSICTYITCYNNILLESVPPPVCPHTSLPGEQLN